MRYATRITGLTLAASLAAVGALAAQKAKPETQAQLMRQAKITKAVATRTALTQVPGGKVKSSEIEREHGKLIYSFDIKVAGKPGIEEINVDALTGAVLAHEHESAKTEKKEAVQDAREKKVTGAKK
jgi:uncharacterized membrane protein YkoI